MDNFSALGLNPEFIKAIQDLGFETPSEIQQKVIPLLLQQATDLVALAQTGTGKTAAFGFPLLQNTQENNSQTQGLILSPTRELCLQITAELQQYAKYLPAINIVAVYGGASISEQGRKIKRGAQIIVATPGRMKDMLQRKMIDISHIKYCVLDEADEMLNMGFYEDITAILSHSPKRKNTWLFSATMPKEVARIAKEFMNQPQEITVGSKNEGTKNVSHEYYVVGARDRYKALKRLVDFNPQIFSVIFCRTKRDTQKVAERLTEEGYNTAALHGDLSQNQRDLVMKSFRSRQIQLLVATDVAARGIDVDDISHVINYQLPDEVEVYTHRSGRTGRAGKTGVSMVLITKSEQRKIKQIENILHQKFKQKEIPSGEDICQVQLFHLAKKISKTTVNPGIEKYLPALEENFESLDKASLIKKVFSVEFTRFYNYYKGAADLNAPATTSTTGNSEGSTRYFISLGEKDGFDWRSLKDFLKLALGLAQEEVFHVDVKPSFSFFNTDSSQAQKVLTTFENYQYEGRKIIIEVASNKKTGRKKRKPARKNARRSASFTPKGKGKPSGKRRKKKRW